MSLILIIVLLLLLFGGGGFYGYRSGHYGGRGFGGILGLLVLLLVLIPDLRGRVSRLVVRLGAIRVTGSLRSGWTLLWTLRRQPRAGASMRYPPEIRAQQQVSAIAVGVALTFEKPSDRGKSCCMARCCAIYPLHGTSPVSC